MKRKSGRCIEISAYKHPIVKDAQSVADSIVNTRIAKLNAARKPYHAAIKDADELLEKIRKYEFTLTTEETPAPIVRMVVGELKELTLKEAMTIHDTLVLFVEKCRIAKQAAVKALRIKAWQTHPLVYAGKHGGNYRFVHDFPKP